LFEGWGLPVLEAMACGTPVITTTSSSLPEAAGDAALLVTPGSPAELAAAILRLTSDEALARELAGKGSGRASAFTFESAAAGLFPVYLDAMRRSL
jgi:glycosyltransferase involved in cell wall biosynthesis